VSGYPPLPAHVLTAPGGNTLRVAHPGPTHTPGPPPSTLPLPPPPLPRPARARCEACRAWQPRDLLTVAALGIWGYCPRCQPTLVGQCLTRAGRLPTADEFFCRYCGALLPRTALVAPDADGRRRWICQRCRARQARSRHRR
jgi:hypothetical protein